MLVLGRKLNQTIRIGDDIFVTVSQIKRGRVRLAISAPAFVAVRRYEIIPNREQSGEKKTDCQMISVIGQCDQTASMSKQMKSAREPSSWGRL